jgi:hypothetical protein
MHLHHLGGRRAAQECSAAILRRTDGDQKKRGHCKRDSLLAGGSIRRQWAALSALVYPADLNSQGDAPGLK